MIKATSDDGGDFSPLCKRNPSQEFQLGQFVLQAGKARAAGLFILGRSSVCPSPAPARDHRRGGDRPSPTPAAIR